MRILRQYFTLAVSSHNLVALFLLKAYLRQVLMREKKHVLIVLRVYQVTLKSEVKCSFLIKLFALFYFHVGKVQRYPNWKQIQMFLCWLKNKFFFCARLISILKSSLDENATKITIFRNCCDVQLWVSLPFNAKLNYCLRITDKKKATKVKSKRKEFPTKQSIFVKYSLL